MKRHLIPTLLLAALHLPVSAQQVPQQASIVQPGRTSQSQITQSQDAQLAKAWGLRDDEFARYRELMEGPIGTYSPNLDPLSALGIEAQSDEERRRYAELQVQVEARRVEKLLAYQRAYDEAWQRLNPGMLRVNLPDDALNTAAAMRQRPHGGVREGRLRRVQSGRAALANVRYAVRSLHGRQPPGRRTYPRLGQARADRPCPRAQRQHHVEP